MKKIYILTILVLIFAVTWNVQSHHRTKETPQTLNFAWSNNVGELNPHLYYPNEMFAQTMVYEPLVEYQSGGKIIPSLAESWTISKDGKEYTFQLRKDVVFSNGEPFNADAVLKNFNAIINNPHHTWIELIQLISKVEKLDEYTIKISLKIPYYPILTDLATARPFRFIAPSQFINNETKDGIKSPIGTGPWILKESRLGEYDRFERNEQYWGEKPQLKEIIIKVIPDENTRTLALEMGDIDFLYGGNGSISVNTYKRIQKNKQFNVQISGPTETEIMIMNSNLWPTNHLKVRQAINYAIDKDSIISNILDHTQIKANSLFQKNIPYTNIPLKLYQYDINKANQLLDEDGWVWDKQSHIRIKDGKTLTIDFYFNGDNAILKSISETIQYQLKQIGIDLKIHPEQASSILTRGTNGNYHIIVANNWGEPYVPHSFLGWMRYPQSVNYQAQIGLKNKKDIDIMITKALHSSNETERQKLYTQIITLLHDEAVYVPLYYTTLFSISNKKFESIPFGYTSYDFPFSKIKVINPHD